MQEGQLCPKHSFLFSASHIKTCVFIWYYLLVPGAMYAVVYLEVSTICGSMLQHILTWERSGVGYVIVHSPVITTDVSIRQLILLMAAMSLMHKVLVVSVQTPLCF